MAKSTILGTIITTEDSPSVNKFSFVINEKNPVKRGEFVAVNTNEGTMVASVGNIFKTNRYFESAGAVKEYTKTSDLHTAFPVKEWEYTIAECHAYGVYTKDGMLNRPSFPPSPGFEVATVDLQMLNKFLGLDQERGIHLGEVQMHDLPAKFNLTKMIQKHMAVLAISGAGKSYATAVLMEELLQRDPKNGRVALFVIDNHGEYVSFKESLPEQTTVFNANEIKIGVSHMNERSIAAISPGMSGVQTRELGKIMTELRKGGNSFDFKDVMNNIREKVDGEELKKNVADPLLAWVAELNSLGVFASADYPNAKELLKQGHMTVINFRDVLSLKKKQLIVNYLSRKLFDYRREGIVPPYLEIIEEAHNFAPEGTRSENAISRGIIETLAREGRKFFANICLISQRPVQLSTTALSQCNTQMIFRVTNPYDLDHIKKSAESISQSTLDVISSLKTGEALVIGEATNHPVFVKIRKRRTAETHGRSLEDEAILYEKKVANHLAKGSEFV